MAEKLVRVGPHKAFKVEGILVGEGRSPQISVRQMYNTQKDPQWRPGRNGFTIPQEYAAKLARAIGLTSQEDSSDFTQIRAKAD